MVGIIVLVLRKRPHARIETDMINIDALSSIVGEFPTHFHSFRALFFF